MYPRNQTSDLCHLCDANVRLLVLGASRVGKSAGIVRFVTGRFIGQYAPAHSSRHWIYRRNLAARRPCAVEIIEQAEPEPPGSQLEGALDEQFVERLGWANAFMVMYAINDGRSFKRAADYLELLRSSCPEQCQRERLDGTPASQAESERRSASAASSSQPASSRSSSSSSGRGSMSAAARPGAHHCRCRAHRPVLLVANKRDLATTDRQVSLAEGRLLAVRYQSVFAEISVAESSRPIEGALCELIELVESPSQFGVSAAESPSRADRMSPIGETLPERLDEQIVHVMCPTPELASSTWRFSPGSRASTRALPAGLADVEAPVSSQDLMARRPATNRRYESFKSSFKRASMAIMGNGTLSRRARIPPLAKDRGSLGSSMSDSSEGGQPAMQLDADQSVGGKLKRSLLKYKSRRTTLALVDQTRAPTLTRAADSGSPKRHHQSQPAHSASQSVSPTSTADSNRSVELELDSGCSDDHQEREDSAKSNASVSPSTSRRRYHIIRSFQSALTSLARSSEVTHKPTKAGFARSLSKKSQPQSGTAVIATPTYSSVVTNLANSKQVQNTPIVGFCK